MDIFGSAKQADTLGAARQQVGARPPLHGLEYVALGVPFYGSAGVLGLQAGGDAPVSVSGASREAAMAAVKDLNTVSDAWLVVRTRAWPSALMDIDLRDAGLDVRLKVLPWGYGGNKEGLGASYRGLQQAIEQVYSYWDSTQECPGALILAATHEELLAAQQYFVDVLGSELPEPAPGQMWIFGQSIGIGATIPYVDGPDADAFDVWR
ncbi:hypothetical protein AUJ68_02655 [Candidatus Woesearchaeota archaeon CG1_02_57_44]|nr:MAG: hypothetical protein AUJ68_02655 [Candidatus Woesearchaeota archaeon CG1_02_57_44]PIN70954.1 MAG: hypothetical protein COV94_00365 [Candidatus Woesearchaeota archaeon CG11_big_fil_rev_8_21_14_0_20_57_5]